MKFKTTLVLTAAFAVLLAAVLLFESKGRRDTAAKEKADSLVDVAAADVQKMDLKKEDGTISFARDDKGAWRITAPLEARADASEAEGLLSSFASLRFERVVDKTPADLKTFEIPREEVALWVKGKDAPVRVLIGMENPLDKSLFAKRADDPRVVLLSSSLKSTLDKKVFDFREKNVFKFEPSDVKLIRVRAKDVSWEAVREGDGWFLNSPVKALAAKSKVDSLLDALSALKATEFLSEDRKPADLRKFGLEKPECQVSLSLPSAGKEIVISLGKDGAKFAAMSSETNKIIAFDGTLAGDLGKKVDEIREKKVSVFSSWEANRVYVKTGEFQIAAAKERIQDADKWLLETAAKDAANEIKVEDFIRRIEGLEAAGFIDYPKSLAEYGLERPAAEVKVRTKGSDGKVLETGLLFGREDKAKKQVVVKNVKIDYLFRVDSAFLQDFPKEAKDWKAEAPKPESALDKKK